MEDIEWHKELSKKAPCNGASLRCSDTTYFFKNFASENTLLEPIYASNTLFVILCKVSDVLCHHSYY